jgi:hypothetical protein
LLTSSLFAQISSFEWLGVTKGLNPTRVRAIHLDKDENVITIGKFTGNISYESPDGTSNPNLSGDDNLYIQKVDSDGNFQWLVDIVSSNGHSAEDIVTDIDGNIYITGIFSGTLSFEGVIPSINSNGEFDAFVVKYSPDGQVLWAFSIGGEEEDSVEGLAIDQAGNIIVVGYYKGTIDTDPSEEEWLLESIEKRQAFVASYDENGHLNWTKQYTDFASDASIPIDATINSKNELIIVGSFLGSIGFVTTDDIEELQSDGAGEIGYVLKLDLNTEGTFIWARTVGESTFGWISLNSVEVTLEDDIVIEAPISGDITIETADISESFSTAFRHSIIFQLADEDGTMQWFQAFTGTADVMVRDLSLDAEGNIYVVGLFAGEADLDVSAQNGTEITSIQPSNEKEHFLAIFSKEGDLQYHYQYGKETFFGFGSAIVIKDEAIYITGVFEQNTDLNPLPEESLLVSVEASSDSYLIKLRRDPITQQPILDAENTWTVFPNPTSNMIVLDGINQTVTYRLYDTSGRLCKEGNINSTENQMNLDHLDKGIYLLQLDNNKVFSIIKH